MQFNGGHLPRRLIATSDALRCTVAKRKAGREAETLADDQSFRHRPINYVTPSEQLEILSNLGSLLVTAYDWRHLSGSPGTPPTRVDFLILFAHQFFHSGLKIFLAASQATVYHRYDVDHLPNVVLKLESSYTPGRKCFQRHLIRRRQSFSVCTLSS